MLAALAVRVDGRDPLRGLVVSDVPELNSFPPDWVRVRVRAAALNHHDLWTLRGVGAGATRLPMVLGTDAAGVDPDGREVIVHAVISDPARRGLRVADPRRTLLSDHYPGTLAEVVYAPSSNLLTRPSWLSPAEAACLPTAWLTAYRMLGKASLDAGARILVQGAGGGVATALISLGTAMGLQVWVAARDPQRAARAVQLGAAKAFQVGDRLPEKVDAVFETVGAATWSHSIKALAPGGVLVTSGHTSGDTLDDPQFDRIVFGELRLLGSHMGTIDDLKALVDFLGRTGVRPVIDSTWPLAQTRDALGRLASGHSFGKVVVLPPGHDDRRYPPPPGFR